MARIIKAGVYCFPRPGLPLFLFICLHQILFPTDLFLAHEAETSTCSAVLSQEVSCSENTAQPSGGPVLSRVAGCVSSWRRQGPREATHDPEPEKTRPLPHNHPPPRPAPPPGMYLPRPLLPPLHRLRPQSPKS